MSLERLEIVEKLEGRVVDLGRISYAGGRRAGSGMDEGLEKEDEVGGGVDKWEREERLKRRNCVILHGLEKSQAVEGVERREADQVLVSEMFGVMNCGEVRTDKVIRLRALR